MTQLTDIQAQIDALKAQAREARAAERKAAHTAEVAARKEDREIFREFDRAMKAEFLARDRAERKGAREQARAEKAERVAQLRQIIETAGFTVAEIRAAIRAETEAEAA